MSRAGQEVDETSRMGLNYLHCVMSITDVGRGIGVIAVC